jgi:hypothetical protein
MVRVVNFNLAVIATLLLGAEAGPCRPTRTAATSVAETTSTLATDTSATSIASTTVTTLADTTTINLEDTTTTAQAEPTTTALADTTTTAEAESTTTTAAAACVETQLFINPGFDDSTSNAYLTQNQPQSGPNALYVLLKTASLTHS